MLRVGDPVQLFTVPSANQPCTGRIRGAATTCHRIAAHAQSSKILRTVQQSCNLNKLNTTKKSIPSTYFIYQTIYLLCLNLIDTALLFAVCE